MKNVTEKIIINEPVVVVLLGYKEYTWEKDTMFRGIARCKTEETYEWRQKDTNIWDEIAKDMYDHLIEYGSKDARIVPADVFDKEKGIRLARDRAYLKLNKYLLRQEIDTMKRNVAAGKEIIARSEKLSIEIARLKEQINTR
jgi:oligoribonuclease NrnB/cAMP/cGMP phosphodiesterase (DHH superfamily)